MSTKGNKTLMLFRYAALYREPIYLEIQKNFDVDFIFIKERKSDLQLMDYTKLDRCKLIGKEITFPFGLYFMTELRRINLNSYDNIIMAGSPRDLTVWSVLLWNIFHKKKILLWTHGWYGREKNLTKVVKRVMFKLADFILVYGNYAKKLMLKNGIDQNKIKIIYNSLDYQSQVRNRENLAQNNCYLDYFENSNPTLIFIGRLTTSKKLHYILEAMHSLEQKKIFCNCIFIGDGTELEKLKSIAEKLKLNKRVWFYGETYSEKELSNLIFNAQICVSPGNVGLTAMHSLVYGTPVITHNNFKNQMPEFEAIISGQTGDFFNENDIRSLTEVIESWLLNHHNREVIRNNCYQVIDEKYNPLFQIEVLKSLL